MNEVVTEAGESGAEATGWSQENLQKLLASMKGILPKDDKTKPYKKGLKAVDWDKVAFPPFSAGECQERWKRLTRKMRRYRTLPELLDEAQELLLNPFLDKNIHPDLPKPPNPPKMTYIRKCMSRYARKNPGVNVVLMTKTFSKDYEKLSDKKKAKYAKKYRLAFEEYSRKINKLCKENNLRVPIKKKKHTKRVTLKYEGDDKDKDFPREPPWHGFGLFIIEHSSGVTGGEPSHGASFIRVMSQHWKELSENEKQKYNKRCAQMKREYKAKLIKYLDRLDEEEKQQLIEEKEIRIPKKILDQHKMHPGEPTMPSRSGFIYFHLDILKHAEKSMPRKERFEKAREQWHKFSESKKNHYAKIVEENMRKFAEELPAWFQTLSEEEQGDYLRKKPDRIVFLQKYIDEKREPLDLHSDEKTSTTKVATRASARLRAKKDGNMFKVHH
ncbi:nucleolar transcription factor 1-B-like [Poecilia formosa]|uniref:Nucleolar transcription factor 1-B-like n=1 Tax=Poecilia formosa TaxID=48698 RepID=A0A096MCA5_POEFO|nr:PREDICTED: nucleolar transcription factor 1-B-like [Poecilia formosa]